MTLKNSKPCLLAYSECLRILSLFKKNPASFILLKQLNFDIFDASSVKYASLKSSEFILNALEKSTDPLQKPQIEYIHHSLDREYIDNAS